MSWVRNNPWNHSWNNTRHYPWDDSGNHARDDSWYYPRNNTRHYPWDDSGNHARDNTQSRASPCSKPLSQSQPLPKPGADPNAR